MWHFVRFLKFKTRKSTWNGSISTISKLLHHWDGRGAFAGVSPSARRGKESEANTASDWPNWNGLIEVMHSRKYWFCCRCRCSVYLTGTSTLFSWNTCSPPPPPKKTTFVFTSNLVIFMNHTCRISIFLIRSSNHLCPMMWCYFHYETLEYFELEIHTLSTY